MSEIKFDPKELLWENKYRPTTIADCVLPQKTRKFFEDMIAQGSIQNLLLTSRSPGTGKTTTALCLMNDLGYEYIFKAAGTGAGEGGIQAMREIQEYASTKSITGKKKAIILDEGDNLTEDAQSALRNIIERYSKSVRFIITANYPEKLSKPLKSRLNEFVFQYPDSDKQDLIKQMLVRSIGILGAEGVKIESKKALALLINHYYPDNRSVLVKLQSYASRGVIDDGLTSEMESSEDIETLFSALSSKKFKVVRELAPVYKDNFQRFITDLYHKGFKYVSDDTKATFIEIVGEANNNFRACADVEILIAYTLTMIMSGVTFNYERV